MKPKARTKDIITQQSDQEVLVYDLVTNQAFLLNQMSAEVWNLCDGNREISTISQRLSSLTNETVSQEYVFLAINQLHKSNLLLPLETDSDLKKFNRREAVKKIGLTTTLMLPVISSLVAPTAVHAASRCSFPGGTTPDGTRVSATGATLAEVQGKIRSQCTSCRYRNSNYIPAPLCPNPTGASDYCSGSAVCCSAPGPGTCVPLA